MLSDDVGLRHI